MIINIGAPSEANVASVVATYISNNEIANFDLDKATDSLYLIPISGAKNCPIATSFVYIRQIFYSNVSSVSNRTQIAYPYASSDGTIPQNCMAIRACNGGVWGEWNQLVTTGYAVNKAGDTMSGDLYIKKDGGATCAFIPDGNSGLMVQAYSDWAKRRFLWIPSDAATAGYGELQYVDMDVDGNGTTARYDIIHTGNKNLITPADIGAATTAAVNAATTAASNAQTTADAAKTAASNAQTTANAAMPKSGGTMTGTLKAKANTSYTTYQVRNIALSTTAAVPTGNGSILGVYA